MNCSLDDREDDGGATSEVSSRDYSAESIQLLISLSTPKLVNDIQGNPLWGRCPECGEYVTKAVNHTCCTKCTQRLKWEE